MTIKNKYPLPLIYNLVLAEVNYSFFLIKNTSIVMGDFEEHILLV